jgi:hypothetical protein
MDLYLLNVADSSGDYTLKLIDKSTWDYIHQPCPNFNGKSFIMETPPTNVDNSNAVPYMITCGSYENDRALFVPEIFKCYSIKKLIEFCNKENITIVEECEYLEY